MANPQVVWHLSKDFFRRNNPIDVLVVKISQGIHDLLTFNSKMKLLKYKFMLAQQQLQAMEQNLNQSGPYDLKGHRINKAY